MNHWRCKSGHRRKIAYNFRQKKKFRCFSALGLNRRPYWSTLSLVSCVLTPESSVGSNEMSESVNLDPVTTHEFLLLLAERARTSHGTSIKASEYKIMSDKMWENLRRRIDGKQLSSKYFRLQKVYNCWRSLMQHTGFSWDHETQSPTCPKEIWQEYLKQNPGAKDFLHKGLVDRDLYEVIFDRQIATGNMAYISTSQPSDSGGIFFRDTIAVDLDEDELQLDTTRLSGEKRSNMSGHGRCTDKKKKNDHVNLVLSRIDKLTEAITQKSLESMAATRNEYENIEENTSTASNRFSMTNCEGILTNMNLDFNIFIRVVTYLADYPIWREILVNMTPEQRTAWVHQKF